ncbi:MAG: hypothetical protein GYA51_19400 [Candidatus Methanofastidiosa archaeon]|nr:hypothetical protein [Candidatus Methanofastidiosa archaeon]
MTYDLAWKVVLREARNFLIRFLKIDLEKEDYETRVREEFEIVDFDNDTIFMEDNYGRIIEHNYNAEEWQVDGMWLY